MSAAVSSAPRAPAAASPSTSPPFDPMPSWKTITPLPTRDPAELAAFFRNVANGTAQHTDMTVLEVTTTSIRWRQGKREYRMYADGDKLVHESNRSIFLGVPSLLFGSALIATMVGHSLVDR